MSESKANEWTNKQTNERMDGWMDAWMDEWMNEWVNEWMDGWMDEQMMLPHESHECWELWVFVAFYYALLFLQVLFGPNSAR
jgi:hypothetical protein